MEEPSPGKQRRSGVWGWVVGGGGVSLAGHQPLGWVSSPRLSPFPSPQDAGAFLSAPRERSL